MLIEVNMHGVFAYFLYVQAVRNAADAALVAPMLTPVLDKPAHRVSGRKREGTGRIPYLVL